MIKRKELQLDKPPVDITEPTETPTERLVRLKGYMTVELMNPNPSIIYMEDLNLTMSRMEMVK